MRRTRRVANRRDFSAFNGERAGVCGSAGPVNNSRVLDQQIVRHPMVPPYLGPARNFERDTRYYSAESKSLRGFLDRGPVDYRREPAPGNRSAAQPVAERREGQRMVLDIEDKDDLRFLVREPRARLECYARRKALGHVVVHAVADLLVLSLVRNVEINFIEIKRHRFFLHQFNAKAPLSTLPYRAFELRRSLALFAILHGLVEVGPVDYRREPPLPSQPFSDHPGKHAEGRRMVRYIEHHDDLGFLVGDEGTGL